MVFEQGEDFEDIGSADQVIKKCIGNPKILKNDNFEKSEDPCSAYRTVKPGVICQTCKKSVNELHLRNDDDAKCLACFEQECVDRLLMEQLKRYKDTPE